MMHNIIELDAAFTKDGTAQDTESTTCPDFKCALQWIKDQSLAYHQGDAQNSVLPECLLGDQHMRQQVQRVARH